MRRTTTSRSWLSKCVNVRAKPNTNIQSTWHPAPSLSCSLSKCCSACLAARPMEIMTRTLRNWLDTEPRLQGKSGPSVVIGKTSRVTSKRSSAPTSSQTQVERTRQRPFKNETTRTIRARYRMARLSDSWAESRTSTKGPSATS